MIFSAKPKTHKDMDFTVTLNIWNANSKEEAEEAVNIMLDVYETYGQFYRSIHRNKVEENPIEINWMAGDAGEVKPI